MQIKKMNNTHLEEVVEVHLESFPSFFMTFLGKRFLYIYYHGVVQYSNCIALVFYDDEKVQGFVVGVMNPANFYSTLIKKDLLLLVLFLILF